MSSSTGPATSTSGTVEGNPVDGAAFCAFLAQIAPRLKADGSSAGAVADLAIELANWIDKHPTQKPRTASDLDDASERTCPQTRTQVVASLGADSFSAALG